MQVDEQEYADQQDAFEEHVGAHVWVEVVGDAPTRPAQHVNVLCGAKAAHEPNHILKRLPRPQRDAGGPLVAEEDYECVGVTEYANRR